MPSDRRTVAFHLAWVTAAAVVLTLGRMHAHHQSDSLIPVFASLYAWTPYYWEQNRFGMVVALLATPFDHPLANLLVQNGVCLWAGLIAFPLAAAVLFRDRTHVAVGPLTAAAWLVLCPPDTQFLYASTVSVIAVSLALGLAGLLAGRRGRWVTAAGCFALAGWTNTAAGLMLAPVVLAAGRRRDVLAGIGLCGFATAFALALQRIAPDQTTHLRPPPPDRWAGLLTGWWPEFIADTANLDHVLLACVGLVLAGRTYRRTGLVLCLGMAAYTAGMLLLFDGRIRYLGPGLVLVHLAGFGGFFTAVGGKLGRWAGLAAVVAALWSGGVPGVGRVRADLRAKWGADADALHAAGATHLAGDYWRVWPVAFQANLSAADRGDPPVWAVTFRSRPTAHLWQAIPDPRVAAFADDPAAADHLPRLGRPLAPAGRSGPFAFWTAQ
jgi:hypothetical protein